ncbi:hypothetical protein SKAU_G00314520 [Synaphobranchus kaupii]|uniref:Uncharacterized protein n=1 Tax=Synaphobranchus kaupii TaxID=118154 RepID=A0A9Q1ESA5_SYNKA|nr:hypothetical protein SKAU_G00314520 [Synaphobranchus kaupii]
MPRAVATLPHARLPCPGDMQECIKDMTRLRVRAAHSAGRRQSRIRLRDRRRPSPYSQLTVVSWASLGTHAADGGPSKPGSGCRRFTPCGRRGRGPGETNSPGIERVPPCRSEIFRREPV